MAQIASGATSAVVAAGCCTTMDNAVTTKQALTAFIQAACGARGRNEVN